MQFESKKDLGIFCSLYNGEKFIKRYLDNVVEQTIFEKVNFYILDCASPDGEFRTIEKYLSYDNIKYKRLDEDPGIYAAWNLCVKWCDEEFIGNWNVDDRKTKDSLEILLGKIKEDSSIDIVYGKTLITNKINDEYETSEAELVWADLEPTIENMLMHNSPHCMPIWKKSLHKELGFFDESFKSAADYDMWLRALNAGKKIASAKKIVGLYYDNPKGISTNPETLNEMLSEVNSIREKYRHEKNNLV